MSDELHVQSHGLKCKRMNVNKLMSASSHCDSLVIRYWLFV